MSKPTWVDVKDGSVTVRIYRTPEGRYPGFTAVYRFAGQRRRKKFASLADAREFAAEQARKIANGETARLNLSDADASSLARALELLKPTGKPIELVASEYAQAVAILGDVPILQAARDYVRRHPPGMASKTVAETIREFLGTKGDRDSDYRRLMESRLARFKTTFPCTLAAITGAEVADWLAKVPGAARTRRNHFADVRALFRFAIRRKYLTADWNELEDIEVPASGPGKIQPFSPEEMHRVLRYAIEREPEWLPYLPVRAFSGIRFEEMGRLRAEHFHSTGWISMDADITKTHARRLVPILPVLRAWLDAYPVRDGALLPTTIANMGPRLVELVRAPGVASRRNGLRDSFASYRMADLRGAGKVAEETGHSTDVLRRSYREIRMPDGRVITPEQAAKWFGLTPEFVTKTPIRDNDGKVANESVPS